MAIPRSPSATSLIPQVKKTAAGTIWNALTNLLSPRGTPRGDETQETETGGSLPLFGSTSSAFDPPQSQPDCESQSSPKTNPSSSKPVAKPSTSNRQQQKPLPPVIVRDFAYEPRPPILERPIDKEWVVRTDVPRDSVPGMYARQAQEWERAHAHLYRGGGNRADPPNVIPKTWGGRPKAEDDALMHRAEARVLERKRKALALGLTLTEPNLGGPPPVCTSDDDEDFEALIRVEAELREEEKKARASGQPLIKTPTHTPSPPGRGRARAAFPHPRTPSPNRTPTRRSKRKRVDSTVEQGNNRETAREGREHKRRGKKEEEDEDAVIARSSDSSHYLLRNRRVDPMVPTQSSSHQAPPRSKNKGKGRAP
ncbi:hypothetical protein K439DRAFT_1636946 [Ramaria rubella]|nr:hypothetical protein K439DRAFT_1636946 [Ramaria rubella]